MQIKIFPPTFCMILTLSKLLIHMLNNFRIQV